jgi:hypothetical protein
MRAMLFNPIDSNLQTILVASRNYNPKLPNSEIENTRADIPTSKDSRDAKLQGMRLLRAEVQGPRLLRVELRRPGLLRAEL